MAKPQVSKEALKAMAALAGLQLSDEELAALLPQMERSAESLAGIDVLGLEAVEPSIVFRMERS